MARPTKYLAESRIPLTMPATMKAALDQFCADRRRATGQPSTRGEVIRDAIAAYLAAHPGPPCDTFRRQIAVAP